MSSTLIKYKEERENQRKRRESLVKGEKGERNKGEREDRSRSRGRDLGLYLAARTSRAQPGEATLRPREAGDGTGQPEGKVEEEGEGFM